MITTISASLGGNEGLIMCTVDGRIVREFTETFSHL